ncbi:tetratricopeptide repeat protein [Mucilaginibacter sp. JRF]|uniref:tetratricopeptide repeat protein n=1 Tax=Mucilaginibacter sp. JRF TaxID=2780088 RepID=UPI00187EE399|nr:tetratricopeptide repeat protein [Mucilaginibacter sp. JRF]
MRLSAIISLLLVSTIETSMAQSAYVKLGEQALLDGNFKSAVKQLEKACLVDSTNANALWMLGYSYYHSENYKKSIVAYTKVLAIKPVDASAYYYRARSKSFLGRDVSLSVQEKEKHLLGAIQDLTKAIGISADPNDMKLYQNRGIAYREYGMFKLEHAANGTDRNRGINSLRASITDLEKVMESNPARSDISTLIDLSKEKLATATGKRN